MTTRTTLWAATSVLAMTLPATAQEATDGAAAEGSGSPYDIATVVKIAGIQWFNRMEEGVKQFAADTGNNAFQVGPAQADPQQQAALLEDMIAQGVDAIGVVPMSPEALEPVLGRAQEAGIVVVSHEAASQQNVSYDIEAFRNEEFGATLMDNLATCMGEEGEYAVFVGSLTSQTHMQWVNGAIARQKEAYPNMTLVGDPNETFDDQQQAYAAAQEVLRANPNIKGMQGSASTDVAGIGLAVEERGIEDQTCVVGTSLPSIAGQYIETGAVDMIGFWDPSLAGYVMNTVAQMILNGEEVTAGMDLGQPGYEAVELDGKVIYGQARVEVNQENHADYPF